MLVKAGRMVKIRSANVTLAEYLSGQELNCVQNPIGQLNADCLGGHC